MYLGYSCPFRGSTMHLYDDTPQPPTIARSSGEPVPNLRESKTVGPRGPVVMEDSILLDDLQHVNRGRIPERLVHAKATGLHGYFEVTNDITKYCAASIFSEVGKRTPQFTRFSIGISQLGSAETTARGVRGISTKFYTEQGNWDLTCLSEPVLSVNDGLAFLNAINAANLDPRRNVPVADNVWDVSTLNPEMVHFQLLVHTDRGIPFSYRHMNGFGINTYKLVNRHEEAVFAKFHLITDQGARGLDPVRAVQLAGSNPDYMGEDIMQAVDRGEFPSWKMSIQVMSFEQAEDLEFNPFDVTKVWPHKRFPLIEVGRLVMNRKVDNHWDETELSAFCPGNFVPGISASPDKNLAARIMAYKDTQMYRLGVNHDQVPINQPRLVVKNYQREGRAVFVSQGAAPHYFPNSFGGPVESPLKLDPPYRVCDGVGRYEHKEPDHYSQPRDFWRNVLDDAHRERTVQNLAANIGQVVDTEIRKRTVQLFRNVDDGLGDRLEEALDNLQKMA